MLSKISALSLLLISSLTFAGGYKDFKPVYDPREFPEGFQEYRALAMTSSSGVFMAFDSLNWFCRNPTDFKSLVL